MIKKILLGLIVLGVGIQFIRPAKNLSATPEKTDLLVLHTAPAEVKKLLLMGCYDCHSENTRYPWYAEIQPLAWWLDAHVRDGKREFNFSTFGDLSAKKKASRLEEVIDQIGSRKMPLKSYTLVHRDAIFTDPQVKAINDWLESVRDKVAPQE
jgi:hypothetical protein